MKAYHFFKKTYPNLKAWDINLFLIVFILFQTLTISYIVEINNLNQSYENISVSYELDTIDYEEVYREDYTKEIHDDINQYFPEANSSIHSQISFLNLWVNNSRINQYVLSAGLFEDISSTINLLENKSDFKWI